jgi:hypothetical protein
MTVLLRKRPSPLTSYAFHRYIVEDKVASREGRKFALGENALDEISTEELKDFINKASVTFWPKVFLYGLNTTCMCTVPLPVDGNA